jgi:hypothetical protein
MCARRQIPEDQTPKARKRPNLKDSKRQRAKSQKSVRATSARTLLEFGALVFVILWVFFSFAFVGAVRFIGV